MRFCSSTAGSAMQRVMAGSMPTKALTVKAIIIAQCFLTVFVTQHGVFAQPVVPLAAAQALSKPVLLPERRAVEKAGGALAAVAQQPAISATVERVRRNSAQQAAQALRRAKPWRPVLNTTRPGDSFGPSAVCGANQLVADGSVSNCRIVVSYSGYGSSTCSAFKIASNVLGTAGHCIYSLAHGGWATSVDVYCTGYNTCGVERTTYAVNLATTPSWMASSTDTPTAWDAAVIKTAGELPGATLQLAQPGSTGSLTVQLTGYPGQSSDQGCDSSAYAGACYQYSSTNVMQVTDSGMYTSSALDLCSGHSGSSVTTADSNKYVIGIVTGASYNPCANLFVPQVNNDSGVNGDCEKPSGGVSLACLMMKLN